jgi:hypothetical protein
MAQKGQKSQTSLPKGVFEALRSLPEDILKEAKEEIGSAPQNPQNQPENDYVNEEKLKELLLFRFNRLEEIRKEEQIVFSAKEQETKSRVESLMMEIRKMSEAVKNLEKQVDITSFSAPVNPGIYHETFFEKLISFIKTMTKNIKNSSLWLSTFNSRAKKNPYYWQQVKKSGSNFYLSQERYMSTQAG